MAFEAHCIVEIMGHQIIAGKVSEETHFGSPLMRVDVPKTSKRDSFTVYYGGGAIYKITPTTEEICAAFVEKQEPEPIKPYMLALPTLAEKVDRQPDHLDYVDRRDYEDDDDEYDYRQNFDDDDDNFDDDDEENEWDDYTEYVDIIEGETGGRFIGEGSEYPAAVDEAAPTDPTSDEDAAIMTVLEEQADLAKGAEEKEVKPE